jgi:hypothetical protein
MVVILFLKGQLMAQVPTKERANPRAHSGRRKPKTSNGGYAGVELTALPRLPCHVRRILYSFGSKMVRLKPRCMPGLDTKVIQSIELSS